MYSLYYLINGAFSIGIENIHFGLVNRPLLSNDILLMIRAIFIQLQMFQAGNEQEIIGN